MIKTAVVILNWNGKHFLEKFLPALLNYSSGDDTDVIIADNASTDDSISFLKTHYPTLRLVILDKNYGFTGGYNRALAQIEAKYYILINSDIEVTPNWTKPLIETLDSDEQIAACQPKIKSYHQRDFFEYAGASGGFIDKFGYPFCRGRILNNLEMDKEQYDDIKEVFWATGACIAVKADLFHKAGGFDDDFFAHMEEIDLCWRLKNLGYKIMVNPQSEVFHVGGGTLPNNSPFKLYLNFRNNLFLLYKNLPPHKLYSILFARMALDGISALMFLAKFSFSGFNAVFKAHIHFYKSIKKLRVKRNNMATLGIKPCYHTQTYHKSIVIDFYIRRKQKFIELPFHIT